MNESQKAFEAWFATNYAAYYGQQAPIAVKSAWQAAEAHWRRQVQKEQESEKKVNTWAREKQERLLDAVVDESRYQ